MFHGTFQSKDPAEKISLPFDLSADLNGETLGAITPSITLDAGSQGAGTTLTVNGSATSALGVVYVPVKDGVHFCDYVVGGTVVTSGGRVLAFGGVLPVRNR